MGFAVVGWDNVFFSMVFAMVGWKKTHICLRFLPWAVLSEAQILRNFSQRSQLRALARF